MAVRYFTELNPKQARHKAIFSHKWDEHFYCKKCGHLFASKEGKNSKQVMVYRLLCGVCLKKTQNIEM